MADEGGESRGVYSIGAVARMLGIPVATIRNWEERYGAIVPERSPGGHRLYSRDQVEQLRFLAAQVSQGFSAADAHRLLAEQSEGGRRLSSDGAGADIGYEGGVVVPGREVGATGTGAAGNSG